MAPNVSTSTVRQADTSARIWTTMSLGGAAVFIIAFVLLHFLRTDLNPITNFGSDYLHGEFGWMMLTAFVGLTTMYAGLAKAFYSAYDPSVRSMVGVVLLAIVSITMLLSGLFPDFQSVVAYEEATQFQKISTYIHLIAGMLGFVLLFVAMIVISLRLQKANLLQGAYRIMLWLAALSPIVFVVMMVAGDALSIVGLGQRVLLSIMVVWALSAAVGLRSGTIISGTK